MTASRSRVLSTMARPDRDHPRHRVHGVFLGPMEVAGYFARLRVGLEAIGIRSVYADLEDHPFSYPEAPEPSLTVRAARMALRRMALARSPISRGTWKLASVITRGVLLAGAIATCDLFVFGSGQTLFGRRELGLLERLGKRVIVVFFGTDVRPSYLDGIEIEAGDASADALIESTRRKRDMIRAVERRATAVVSHAPTSQLLSRTFVDWLAIGIPTMPRPVPVPRADGPLRVLHAPSHGMAKGTSRIREAIDHLRAAGTPIEYRELEGGRNEVVAEAIASADIVIDQLYADTPMAVLAAEAAAAGRPTIVGSVDWAAILEAIPDERLPPTVRIEPEALEATLRQYAASPGALAEAGQRARDFVRRNWLPEAVARRIVTLAEGSAPPDWSTDPATVGYAAGCGVPRDRLATVLARIAERDADPFGVADKPSLERRLRSGGIGG